MTETLTPTNVGSIVEIKGVVVDAVFPDGCPPSTTPCASRFRARTGSPAST